MSRSLQRVVLSAGWLLIAAIIAIGGAGLVAATANLPGTPGRAELTTAGDAAAAVALGSAQTELIDLAADVERLGELGRGALVALVASEFETLDKAVADGEALARTIDERSAALREQLRLVPGSGPNEAIVWSPETRQRRDLALGAVEATSGLEIAWSRFAAGSTVANRLTVLLVDHDTTAGEAAAQGRAKKYAAGLKTLAAATALLDQAKSLRDALANTVDVDTLTQWIDRNAEYDTALAALFQATIDAKGAITAKQKAAAIAERKAHDLLPANTSGLVIILAEIGRGGLNQAVIGIEETRAKLQAAVDRLTAPASAEPDPPTDGDGQPSEGAPTG
ncbi:MAG: hypothetical protein H0U52_02090 [Chloroflexi bacterium]|nr:hypothetical protein [Chloroflexota bacterium]